MIVKMNHTGDIPDPSGEDRDDVLARLLREGSRVRAVAPSGPRAVNDNDERGENDD